MDEFKKQSALLTRTEIDWLLGKAKVSKAYEYRMKSDIKKKLKIFNELELPILIKQGFTENCTLSKYAQNLMTNPQVNNQNVSINSLNFENCPQNMVGRKGCVTISVPKRDSNCQKFLV